ncbi:hypothetical protein OG762_36525 [Streptomyces sp. NBC_01136]|uniref:hypothetical protein n=1 Tax=Streptomyces sp. NBC_01136 TaxID=2903754 RepID=UPI003868CE8C|nr:hypothetical protein OG762_36525 [Streptomyces sp. NBC_01136]
MSTTVTVRRHRAPDRIAELEARLAQVEADSRALIARNEELICELTGTILAASRYSLRAAVADEENGRLKAANEDLRHKTIRAKAEQERLRQAVINARPRIREVPSAMVRPFAPVVVLPYVSPVPYRSTANDETQQLPILDQPQKAVWPVYATAATT